MPTRPLNVDLIVNEWIPALESGEYQQDGGYLHTEKGYCCLGVLCDIGIKQGMLPNWEREIGYPVYSINKDGTHSISMLPEAMHGWVGTNSFGGHPLIQYPNPETGEMERRTLSSLNDNGHSFAEIAQVLREAVEKQEKSSE